MNKLVNDRFVRLSDDLVEEVFFRLPPDEPACLVRASAVRKNWCRILADAGFHRRYREFHRTPPVLGIFQENGSFVTTSGLFPIEIPDRPKLAVLDCRHGRVLFNSTTRYFGVEEPFGLIVLDPLTGRQWDVPSPDDDVLWFSAAVLCAAQGCDHHGCEGRHFRVTFLTTDQKQRVTLGWLYSSETCLWSELTSVHHPNVTKYTFNYHEPSVLLGDALYFNLNGVIKCDLGTLRLSMFERPANAKGRLMTAEDGGLGFAAMVDFKNLALWSMETGPEGDIGWAKLRVIDLEMLLPDGALWIPRHDYGISGVAEGTQVISVNACGCYMADLKSRRVRKVAPRGIKSFPYMSLCMPAMEAASTAGVSSVCETQSCWGS